MGFGVWCSGFEVEGLGFGGCVLCLRVWRFWVRVWGFGFWVWGSGFRGWEIGVQISGFGFQILGVGFGCLGLGGWGWGWWLRVLPNDMGSGSG